MGNTRESRIFKFRGSVSDAAGEKPEVIFCNFWMITAGKWHPIIKIAGETDGLSVLRSRKETADSICLFEQAGQVQCHERSRLEGNHSHIRRPGQGPGNPLRYNFRKRKVFLGRHRPDGHGRRTAGDS